MPYELLIASRQNPDDKPGRADRQALTVSTLVLTGALDHEASDAVLATVAKVGVEGASSIVVEFADVSANDRSALDALIRGIMSLREHGAEVQIFVRDDALHANMATLANSRDWLLSRAADGSALPRIALHVDAGNGLPPEV